MGLWLSRGNIDAIAVNVVCLNNDIAMFDANAILDPVMASAAPRCAPPLLLAEFIDVGCGRFRRDCRKSQ